ncbi:MAG TPA: hypothetical protein VGL75_04025 [Acidothermaceae bacterium]
MVALLVASAVVYAAVHLGAHAPAKQHLQLGTAAPFFGQRRHRIELTPLWPAAALGIAIIAAAPLTRRLSWWLLMGCAWVSAAGWAVLLAASSGWHGVASPLTSSTEYRAALPSVANPIQFVRGFVSDLHTYPTQVKGHPPLPVIVLWSLEHLGLRGAGWSAALVIAVGTSAVVAVAITLRCVGGADLARRALPFLVLAPGTAWIATSMDGFFAGVVAWGVALVAISRAQQSTRGVVASAAAGGLLLGCVPYLSYGLLPVAALGVTALLLPLERSVMLRAPRGRRWWALGGVAVGFGAVVVAFTADGFWWPDGVRATHRFYAHNYGSGSRPYAYFLLADLAVFVLMIGPAAVAGLARINLRRRTAGWLVVAALVAVVASDLSGVMRGEVERIWLPYAPWVVVAAAALTRTRGWLLLQVAVALAVQGLVISPW